MFTILQKVAMLLCWAAPEKLAGYQVMADKH